MIEEKKEKRKLPSCIEFAAVKDELKYLGTKGSYNSSFTAGNSIPYMKSLHVFIEDYFLLFFLQF